MLKEERSLTDECKKHEAPVNLSKLVTNETELKNQFKDLKTHW